MALCNNSVCAVIITYFPDRKFQHRLKIISQQVKQIIIVDNGSTGMESLWLDKAINGRKNVDLIKNRVNLGMATALNQGVRKAINYGYSWIVTFDQDSEPQANMVQKMLDVWERYPNRERLMVVGPEISFCNCSQNFSAVHTDAPWEEVAHVITSGSLISKEAFESAGYFLDSLFIDYVDIEYCLRLRNRGYDIIQVRDAILLHKIGNIEGRFILWKIVHPTHHDPIRRYYQFRNAVLLHKMYKKAEHGWCRSNRAILMKIMCLILLYEKHRLRSFLYIIKGLYHGFSGRAGQRGEIPFLYSDTI